MQACESVQIGSSGLTIDLNTNKHTTYNGWVTVMPVNTRIEPHVDNIPHPSSTSVFISIHIESLDQLLTANTLTFQNVGKYFP